MLWNYFAIFSMPTCIAYLLTALFGDVGKKTDKIKLFGFHSVFRVLRYLNARRTPFGTVRSPHCTDNKQRYRVWLAMIIHNILYVHDIEGLRDNETRLAGEFRRTWSAYNVTARTGPSILHDLFVCNSFTGSFSIISTRVQQTIFQS